MALFVFTVLWENVASLMRGAKFWETWEGTEYPKVSDMLARVEENEDDGLVGDAAGSGRSADRNSTRKDVESHVEGEV